MSLVGLFLGQVHGDKIRVMNPNPRHSEEQPERRRLVWDE